MNNSSETFGAPATKKGETAPFRTADWLRRWAANGNSVELLPDGKLWVLYALDSNVGGGWRVRDDLEVRLTRQRGVPAVKVLMARAGLRSVGVAA